MEEVNLPFWKISFTLLHLWWSLSATHDEVICTPCKILNPKRNKQVIFLVIHNTIWCPVSVNFEQTQIPCWTSSSNPSSSTEEMILDETQNEFSLFEIVKGALDKCNIIPTFSKKKVGFFYTIRSVGMGNDCMLSFTF